MAFETLGLNITASGIAGVARQMGHLANSFIKYINVVERTDRAALKTAASQNKLAQTMSDKAGREVEKLERRYANLTRQQERLQTSITVLNLRMGDGAKINDRYKNALNALNAVSKIFANETKDIAQLLSEKKAASDAVASATAAVTQAQEKLNNAEQASQRGAFTANLNKKKRLLEEATAVYIQATAAVERYYAAEREKTNAEKEYRKAANALATYHTQLRRLIEAMEDLVQVEEDAEKTAEDLEKAKENLGDTTETLTKTTQTYEDMLNEASEQTSIFGRLLSDLTGGFGQSTMATSGMTKALGLTVPQLAAVMVAMDAIVLGVKAAQFAFNLFMRVLKTAWSIFTKTVQVVWNLAKAIGTTLWNALKKILSFPFSIVNKLFGGVGGSLQRVMEMAIGMNMSRVWWQLGLKFRDLAKTASDAATEYQVTFMRLRGLMLNEVLGKQGVMPSDPDYIIKYNAALLEANRQTQELVTWTSKLAVATIFDAESILDVYTLAMAYDFTSKSAKELTSAVLDFATGMGLGDTEMRRVIENFGQMRAQGKIVGTELRDLARGAFVPVNEVLERMAKNAGVIGDYDVPNLQEITSVLNAMRESGELTESAFASISAHIAKLGSDGKITRQEFETLSAELKDPAVLQRFGLTAEQAGKALEGIKTGQLTKELNDLIATGKLTIDEFFEAFIEMAEDRFPNAAMSMGMSMKALRSNLEDYIKTMFGWRLLAPVFEIVAKHVQGFVQNTLMSESQIQLFDRMGLAFKNVTELLLTYSDAVLKARSLSKQFFGMGNISQMWRFANEFATIIGSLGTKEFAEKFNIFKFALKQIPLAGESRQLVLSGMQELNKIMSDIMAGIEVDPAAMKQAMSNVFGTLWNEYFKPELGKLWDENVIPAIKRKIGELWANIQTAFNTWKTDKLLPKLKTFLTETLPEWFGGIAKWIKKNGPQLISDIAKFVQDILTTFAEGSASTFGKDHWLTRLLELLASLAGYGAIKIQNPAADISAAALDAVADSLNRFVDAVGNAFGKIGFVQRVYEVISSPKAVSGMGAFVATMGGVIDVLTALGKLVVAPIDAVLATITAAVNLIVELFNIKKPGGDSVLSMDMGGLYKFANGVLGAVEILMGLGNLLITGGWRKIEFVFKFLTALSRQDWAGVGEAFELAFFDTGGVDSIVSGVERLAGMDTKRASSNVQAMVDSVGKWLRLAPGDRSWDINTDINFTFDVNEPSPSDIPVGYAYNRKTGALEYVGQSTTHLGVEYVIGIEVETEINVEDPSPSQIPAGFAWDTVTKELVFVGARTGSFAGAARELIYSTKVYYTTTEETDVPPKGTDWVIGANGERTLEWVGVEKWREVYGGELNVLYNVSMSASSTTTMQDLLEDFWVGFGRQPAGPPRTITMPVPEISSNGDFSSAASNLVSTFVSTATTDMANVTIPNPPAPDTTNIGKNMGQGIINGINSKQSAAVMAAATFVAAVNAEFLNLWKIESPSKVFVGYGENLIKGLILGIRRSTGDAVSQARDAAIDIKHGFGSSVNSGNYSYTTNSNNSISNNWNVKMSTPIIASTPLQAYEVLRMRAR